MRKVNVLEFVSLDGVIQAPGGPEEDTSGGFAYGGWISPHSDPVLSTAIRKQMNMPFDLLIGRRTFDIWAPFWPQHSVPTGKPQSRWWNTAARLGRKVRLSAPGETSEENARIQLFRGHASWDNRSGVHVHRVGAAVQSRRGQCLFGPTRHPLEHRQTPPSPRHQAASPQER